MKREQQPEHNPANTTHALLLEWAWGQVEAMADGSLNPQQQQRMREAMALDETLALAVKRACGLLHDLRRPPPPVVPRGLWRRLWQIPTPAAVAAAATDRGGVRRAGRQPSKPWARYGYYRWLAPAAALGLALVLLIAMPFNDGALRQPGQLTAEQKTAIKDFTTAMHYVQKTATVTGKTTTRGMGGSLQHALTMGMNTWITDDRHFENGD